MITNKETETMTTEDLNSIITEKAKEYGSKNAFLASSEYRELYNQWSVSNTRPDKVTKFKAMIVAPDWGNGKYFIQIGPNKYAANGGLQFGMCAGPVSFGTKIEAEEYFTKNKF